MNRTQVKRCVQKICTCDGDTLSSEATLDRNKGFSLEKVVIFAANSSTSSMIPNSSSAVEGQANHVVNHSNKNVALK